MSALDPVQLIFKLNQVETMRVLRWVAEHLKEGGGEEFVAELEGVAAGAAEIISLIQKGRNTILLMQSRKRQLDVFDDFGV